MTPQIKRMNRQQKEILLDFIEIHKADLSPKTMKTNGSKLDEDSRRPWQEVADSLNAVKGGCVKSWEKWHQAFIDWKSEISQKSTIIENGQLLKLTKEENRLLELIRDAKPETALMEEQVALVTEKSSTKPTRRMSSAPSTSDSGNHHLLAPRSIKTPSSRIPVNELSDRRVKEKQSVTGTISETLSEQELAASKLQIEKERLKIESERLQIEKERFAMEKEHNRLSIALLAQIANSAIMMSESLKNVVKKFEKKF